MGIVGKWLLKTFHEGDESDWCAGVEYFGMVTDHIGDRLFIEKGSTIWYPGFQFDGGTGRDGTSPMGKSRSLSFILEVQGFQHGGR